MWRRSGEGSEDRCRGLGPPRETIEDLFDHRWIFDARDHLHRAAAVFAGLDIDPENPLQPWRPRHRDVARGHGPIGGFCLASATSGRGDLLTQSMIRRKDAVVARKVHARRRHQYCLPGHDKSAGLPIWAAAGWRTRMCAINSSGSNTLSVLPSRHPGQNHRPVPRGARRHDPRVLPEAGRRLCGGVPAGGLNVASARRAAVHCGSGGPPRNSNTAWCSWPSSTSATPRSPDASRTPATATPSSVSAHSARGFAPSRRTLTW